MTGAADGATPIDVDEREGLIPGHISTRAELNQWEALNIAQALHWLRRRRGTTVVSVDFLRELHKRMFGRTWKWAGTFRRSDKNVSPHHWTAVPTLMQDLVDDTVVRLAAASADPAALDDVAMRVHHQLVRIHPWPATDELLTQQRQERFSWGGGNDLESTGDARVNYIAALRLADSGDFSRLRAFVRS